MPPHVGHKGWAGARLDADLDWDEPADLVEESYRLIAPKSLWARLRPVSHAHVVDSSENESYVLRAIGRVESQLEDPEKGPKQGDEGLPEELRLLSRALFVVGPANRVDYVEYVEELADHPDYDAILRAVKQAA